MQREEAVIQIHAAPYTGRAAAEAAQAAAADGPAAWGGGVQRALKPAAPTYARNGGDGRQQPAALIGVGGDYPGGWLL